MSYTIRPATPDDIQAVVHVQRTARTHDFGSTTYTESNLQASWQADGFDLGADTWVAVDDGGEVDAYAEIPGSSDNEFWVDLQVLPEHRDKGIEAAILPLVEDRLLSRDPSSVEKPNILFGRAGDVNRSAQAAFIEAGYDLNISFQIMQVELTKPPPAPDWPKGVTVRTFRVGEDDQPAYFADEESAEDKGYHSPLTFEGWAARMGRNKPDFDPSLWFLAWDGEEVAAVCLNYRDADNIGWIDHLGVRRAWRKKGLGMALLRHSFAEFYSRGITTIKLIVDSHSLTNAPRLYEQAGMQVQMKYHIYRKSLP